MRLPETDLEHELARELASAIHHKALLGQALHDVLVAAGVLRNVDCTGPELLAVAADYTNSRVVSRGSV